MVDLQDRLTAYVKQRSGSELAVFAGVAVVVLLAAVRFAAWIAEPSYTLLYAGVDQKTLAEVVDHLDASGIPYKLEGGGRQVMVPRNDVYTVRAQLAQDGLTEAAAYPGWELLDQQDFSTSNFKQEVDYQRALQGELAKTLTAMNGIRSATVHLVTPKEALFASEQKPTTASIMLTTGRDLTQPEIEAVVYLVSASVEGLDASGVTVTDARGQVLHAPDVDGQSSTLTDRYLRQTREFESALKTDISQMLSDVLGPGKSSVQVHAQLDFDKVVTEQENYNPDEKVTVRESTETEHLEGNGAGPGGNLGVDGGDVEVNENGEYLYDRSKEAAEYGVGRTHTVTERAPGRVSALSVALIVDESSSLTDEDLEGLVSAAVGLNEARGDTVAISRATFAASGEPTDEVSASSWKDLVPTAAGVVGLLAAIGGLFMLARRKPDPSVQPPAAAQPAAGPAPAKEAPVVIDTPVEPAKRTVVNDVVEVVKREPEDVANLIRSWVTDNQRPA